MIRARDIMTTSVVSVRPDDPIERAIDLLLRHRVSGMPVVEEGDRLVGLLSEHDLLGLLFDHVPQGEHVRDFMVTKVHSVTDDEPVVSVAERFSSGGFRRLPVVRDGKLLGMISRHDLIRLIRDVRTSLSQRMAERAAAAGAKG